MYETIIFKTQHVDDSRQHLNVFRVHACTSLINACNYLTTTTHALLKNELEHAATEELEAMTGANEQLANS